MSYVVQGDSVRLSKVIDVEGGIGKNVFAVMAEMREMAQRDHCTYRMEINGKKVSIDEHTPFWIHVKWFEESK
jgi:hypothetical protein